MGLLVEMTKIKIYHNKKNRDGQKKVQLLALVVEYVKLKALHHVMLISDQNQIQIRMQLDLVAKGLCY